MKSASSSHVPSNAGVWKENNVIAMLEQNSVWRRALSLGKHLHLDKGRRWTDFPGGDVFAFLDSGLIRLSSLGENGSERIFLHIGAGCIFNELSCMHVAPLSTASFLAMEPCEIYQFPKSLLENRDFVLQYPELMMNLVQSLMLKAGAFFGQIEESVGLSPENLVCRYLGNNEPCRTAEEPIMEDPSPELMQKAAKVFPLNGAVLAADRLGSTFADVVEKAASEKDNELLCECEMVSMAEVEYVARDPATHSLHDVRLRTRLGMGTCQGTFCSLRAIGALTERNVPLAFSPTEDVSQFLQERWRGLRPALWGKQLKEIELGRAIYAATLNLDGAGNEQEK